MWKRWKQLYCEWIHQYAIIHSWRSVQPNQTMNNKQNWSFFSLSFWLMNEWRLNGWLTAQLKILFFPCICIEFNSKVTYQFSTVTMCILLLVQWYEWSYFNTVLDSIHLLSRIDTSYIVLSEAKNTCDSVVNETNKKNCSSKFWNFASTPSHPRMGPEYVSHKKKQAW